ncbi:hypothetical protein [Nitrosopumilus sp.]|uniref:hypothetical protein n=1 Tax=Nitrosopumilus sp. TaxID=2024843 RepID=UPI00292E6D18|nr:hypothetical protein [Nitrosopumilus sp.]
MQQFSMTMGMSLNHEPFDRNLRQALGELTRLKDKIAFQNKFLKKYSDLFERLGSEKEDF